MKKLLLTGTALMLSLTLANAQGWSATGAHDDFASLTQYDDGTGKGIFWFETSAGLTITRAVDSMVIAATGPAASTYPLFGLDFGSGNSVDLSGGQANIQIDIENKSSQLFFAKIELEDTDGDKSDIEPDISDITSTMTFDDAHRKANNGFTLAANQRKTITIDLSSVSGALGGLTRTGWGGTGPFDSPTTSYALNAAAVKAVLFTMNFGSDPFTYLSEGDGNPDIDTEISAAQIQAYTGEIIIRDFRIGSTVTTGVNESKIESSLKVYPNPAKDVLNVSFESNNGATVSLTDIVGNEVYSSAAAAGENRITVNTSNLSSGLYILNVSTENGKVARKVTVK